MGVRIVDRESSGWQGRGELDVVTQTGFTQKVQSKIQEHVLRETTLFKNIPATATTIHAPFKITKMDVVENGEQCL